MWFTTRVPILVLCSLLGAQALSLSDLTNFGINVIDNLPLIDFGLGEILYSSILNLVGSFNCKFHKDVDYNVSQVQLYHYSFDTDGIVTSIYNVSNGAGPLFRSMGSDAVNYSYHIYIPGLNSGPTADSWSVLRSTYQSINDSNTKFFALDHSEYTTLDLLVLISYDKAVTYTYHIGKQMGVYLSELVSYGVPIENIYIFGHSLGAHITGFAASHLKNLTGESLLRISGLDPAAPCFTNQPMENVIDDSDADYVDIMHCDAGGLGWTNNYGSADFHPNGGKSQPTCKRAKFFLYYNVAVSSCSHNVCPVYFALGLLEDMIGERCGSWKNYTSGSCEENEAAVIGKHYNATTNGTYYLSLV